MLRSPRPLVLQSGGRRLAPCCACTLGWSPVLICDRPPTQPHRLWRSMMMSLDS
jgi:hypothetical protein